MTIREPVAFLSYVRSDDEHDWGRITKLRQRLEGEVKIQTGRPFAIFQDRNDIIWGQQWAEVIQPEASFMRRHTVGRQFRKSKARKVCRPACRLVHDHIAMARRRRHTE